VKLAVRLSLALTSVVAVTLGLSFVAVGVLVVRDETRDLDDALRAQAEAASELVRARGGSDEPLPEGFAQVPEILDPMTRNVAVYDASGSLRFATPRFDLAPSNLAALGAGALAGQPIDLGHGEGALRAVVLPLKGSHRTLLYAVSRRAVDADYAFIFRILAAIYVTALTGTMLVARWLGRRLTADVSTIAVAARAVARGELDARVGPSVRGSTETHGLASDLDHMIEQLSGLVSAQRTFISHAAHELRSPLTAIRGEIQLALRRPRENEAYQRTLVELLADVEGLAHLAEDLLTLARIQAGMTPGPGISASDVVSDAAHMARGLADARGVEVRLPLPDDPIGRIVVIGGGGDAARALRNLIDNAIAHSPEGSVVAVSLQEKDGRVAFSVCDHGEGVDPQDAPNLFEPFYRGVRESGGEPGGAGIGLAIARNIARACGGDLVHDARFSPGARFVLTLPVAGAATRSG
jgi:two-component system OmpR family sensor kinase